MLVGGDIAEIVAATLLAEQGLNVEIDELA